VRFKSLGAVSYSPSIVTMVVFIAVCEIFSVKEWCDLENRVRVRSRSLKMTPFDRSHTRTDRRTDRIAISISRVSTLTRDKYRLHLLSNLPDNPTKSKFTVFYRLPRSF